MRSVRFLLATVAAAGLATQQASADFLTSASGLVGTPTLITFDDFAFDPAVSIATPFTVAPGVTVQGDSGAIGSQNYTFVDNGDWNLDNTGRGGFVGSAFSADFTGTESITFTFDAPVSGVGGFINYATEFFLGDDDDFGPDVTLEALDAMGNVLESYTLSLGSPGEIQTFGQDNAGAFRGIQRAQNDIFAFRLSNQGVALDDLQFVVAADAVIVPLPAGVLAAFGGIVSLTGLTRLRRRA